MDIKSQLARVDYAVTICSIAPFSLRERKPGLYPGEFVIPACKDMMNDVESTVIDECRFYVYLDLERGSFPVRASAEQVGVSLINDFINAQIAVNEGCYPGLFLMPGKARKDEILNSPLLETARECQLRWYHALVALADDDWEKYHQHRAISEIQRHAAKALKLDRPWIISSPVTLGIDSVVCLVCRTQLAPGTILCPNCRFVIDEEAYNKIRHRFIGGPVQPLNTNPTPPAEVDNVL